MNNFNSHELLIAPNYTFIEGYLKQEFNRVNLNGKNILVLGPIPNTSNQYGQSKNINSKYYEELNNYFKNTICSDNTYFDAKDIQVLNSKTVDREAWKHSVIISSAYDVFLNENILEDNNFWFQNLGLVVFENITDFVSHNRIWSSLLSNLLHDYCQCKVIYLASERMKLGAMVSAEYNINPRTREDFFNNPTNFIYFSGWNREGQNIQDKVIFKSIHFTGLETMIVQMAQKLEISNQYFINISQQPLLSYIEEVEEANSKFQDTVEQHLLQCQNEKNNRFIVTDDLYNNLSYILYRHKIPGIKKMFLNVCSKPYLFRDYMANNILYFNQYTFKPFAPKIERNNEKNKLLILYEKLRRYKLYETSGFKGYPETKIREYLILDRSVDIYNHLIERYKRFFNRDLDGHLKEYKYKLDSNLWKITSFFRIESLESFWLDSETELFKVVDDHYNNVIYDYIPKDLVEQYFFADSYFSYHQLGFKLKKIDYNNKNIFIERIILEPKERVYLSKMINRITLNQNTKDPISKFLEQNFQIRSGFKRILNYYNFDSVTVKSIKRFDFFGEKNFDYNSSQIIFRDNEQAVFGENVGRSYKGERTLIFFLDGTDSNLLHVQNLWVKYKNVINKISQTLCYLIKESLITFIPNSHQFLDVVPLNKQLNASRSNAHLELLSSIEKDFNFDDGIGIVFIEDAIQDLGLLEAIEDNFESILETIDDYLQWYLSHNKTSDIENKTALRSKVQTSSGFNQQTENLNPSNLWEEGNTTIDSDVYKLVIDETEFIETSISGTDNLTRLKTDFLRNINNQHADFLQLEALKDILHSYLGNNTITRRRLQYKKIKEVEIHPETIDGKEIHQCDFCGSRNKVTEMVIIKDGRERCAKCSETALDKKEDYKDVFSGHVVDFFNAVNQTKPQDNLDVFITYANKVNEPFGGFHPSPMYDSRVLGYAHWLGDEYKILAENGAPKKRSILTIIHEWVHIWQYTNIDYEKLNKDYDKYFIEGHTTWSEIYYASKVKGWGSWEEWEQKIAPLSRKDEYGDGYRMVRKLLKDSGVKDPFIYLLKFYKK